MRYIEVFNFFVDLKKNRLIINIFNKKGMIMFKIIDNQTDLETYINQQQWTRFIYKHSATCPTSIYAKQEVEQAMEKYPDVSVIYIHVWDHRDLSNRVAEYFDITHESPQLLTMKGNDVKDVKNHYSVTAAYMQHILGGWFNDAKSE